MKNDQSNNYWCKEKGCGWRINKNRHFLLKTGCINFAAAFPCEKCGRLHFADGSPVFNRPGDRAFFENDKIVHKKVAESSVN